MKKGKFQKRGKLNVKALSVVLVLVLLIGGVIGGTLAWLTDKTTPVTNTFSTSDINITLTETGTDTSGAKSFKMIPGHTITKDPKVTVESGSEDCWVFVKIVESTTPDLDTYISYAIADGWTTVQEENANGEIVIGRKVYQADKTKTFSVLEGDKVTVPGTVTKALMEAIDGKDENGAAATEPQPTLTFTAYATQLYKTNSNLENAEFTAAEAWAIACPPTTGN